MRRFFFTPILLTLLALPAAAQFSGYVSPQTIVRTPFSSVACTGSKQTAVIPDIGQTVHFGYVNGTGIKTGIIQIEGSNDGVVYQTISQDATFGGSAQTGFVFGMGYFPIVRIAVTCTGTNFTVNYTGTSATPAALVGADWVSQYAKSIAYNAPAGTPFTQQFIPPFGTSAGIITFVYNSGAGPAGSTLNVACWNPAAQNPSIFSAALSAGAGIQTFSVPAVPCSKLAVSYQPGGASADMMLIDYMLSPSASGLVPAGGQPPSTANTEQASAVNAAVTTTVSMAGLGGAFWPFQRSHIFAIGARCSAGTSSVTVQDGSTTIWTSGPTEVGTATSKWAWNPGLAGTAGKNLTVTLGTCGAGNTGTLDVQASIF